MLVTHDPSAVELVDRALTLRDGRLVDEPPPDLMTHRACAAT